MDVDDAPPDTGGVTCIETSSEHAAPALFAIVKLPLCATSPTESTISTSVVQPAYTVAGTQVNPMSIDEPGSRTFAPKQLMVEM